MNDIFSGLNGLAPRRQSSRYVDRAGEWIVELESFTRGIGKNEMKASYGVPFVAARLKIVEVLWEDTPEGGGDPNVPGMDYSWYVSLDSKIPEGLTKHKKDYLRNIEALQELLCHLTGMDAGAITSDLAEQLISDGGAGAKGMRCTLKGVKSSNTSKKTGLHFVNTYFNAAP